MYEIAELIDDPDVKQWFIKNKKKSFEMTTYSADKKKEYYKQYIKKNEKVVFVPVREFSTVISSEFASAYMKGYESFKKSKMLTEDNPYLVHLQSGKSDPRSMTVYDITQKIGDKVLKDFELVDSLRLGYDLTQPITMFRVKYPRSQSYVQTTEGRTICYNNLDGHHRIICCSYLGIENIPVQTSSMRLHGSLQNLENKKWRWYQPIDFGVPNNIHFDHKFNNNNHGVQKYQYILHKHVNPTGRVVIDLGCNTGVITAEIAKHGAYLVIGIDTPGIIERTIRVYNLLWKDYGNLVFKGLDLRNVTLFETMCRKSLPIDCILMTNALYYLGDQVDIFLHVCSKFCPKIILQGNKLKRDQNGQFSTRIDSLPDYRGEYAQIGGMVQALEKYGYSITVDAPEGYSKPVVIGEKL